MGIDDQDPGTFGSDLDKHSFLIRGRRGFATLTEKYPRRLVEFILN